MKTKKHMIEVEIPTGKYCGDCEFLVLGDGSYCRLFDDGIEWNYSSDGRYKPRCDDCIEKFGLEDDND